MIPLMRGDKGVFPSLIKGGEFRLIAQCDKVCTSGVVTKRICRGNEIGEKQRRPD